MKGSLVDRSLKLYIWLFLVWIVAIILEAFESYALILLLAGLFQGFVVIYGRFYLMHNDFRFVETAFLAIGWTSLGLILVAIRILNRGW